MPNPFFRPIKLSNSTPTSSHTQSEGTSYIFASCITSTLFVKDPQTQKPEAKSEVPVARFGLKRALVVLVSEMLKVLCFEAEVLRSDRSLGILAQSFLGRSG